MKSRACSKANPPDSVKFRYRSIHFDFDHFDCLVLAHRMLGCLSSTLNYILSYPVHLFWPAKYDPNFIKNETQFSVAIRLTCCWDFSILSINDLTESLESCREIPTRCLRTAISCWTTVFSSDVWVSWAAARMDYEINLLRRIIARQKKINKN